MTNIIGWAGLFIALGVQASTDDLGYIYYAKSDLTIGAVQLHKDDAILINPKLNPDYGRVAPDLRGSFAAKVDFKVMENGKPKGDWRNGWVYFENLKRSQPISQMDSSQWTTEPSQARFLDGLNKVNLPPEPRCPLIFISDKAKPPTNPFAASCPDVDCLAVTEMISEFHNSELCDRINRAAGPGVSRRDQLLESWAEFIKNKSGGTCSPGPGGQNGLCNQLNRARDTDILARTAIFEAEGPSKDLPSPAADSRHSCEEDFIMLAIRNIALDPGCKSGKRAARKSGLQIPGRLLPGGDQSE